MGLFFDFAIFKKTIVMKYILIFLSIQLSAVSISQDSLFKDGESLKGITKFELQDFRGAISDYSKAIAPLLSCNSNFAFALLIYAFANFGLISIALL